ncbi:hypothetical protein ES708_25289 [subsurface metagenome]
MALHTKWSSGDLIFYDGTQDIFTIKNSTGGILVGEDDEGVDVKFYGDTTGAYMLWDEDADGLVFAGGAGIELDEGNITIGETDYLIFGDATEIKMSWTTGDVFEVLPAAADADVELGSATLPLAVKFFGTTGTSAYMKWTTTGNILDIDEADITLGDADYVKFGDTGEATMRC